MSASLFVQYVVVALAVLASLGMVMKKQFPNATRRLRVAVALPLLREGCPGWLRGVGKWVAPAIASMPSACGGCDNCEPPERF